MDKQVSITVDGRRYRGRYMHQAGSLPVLRIAGTIWSGSSVGPANHLCAPDAEDREYWRHLIRSHVAAKAKGE